MHGEELALPMPEVLQETAVLHELGDDVDGFLHSAHGIQLKQVGMLDLLHHLGLRHKVIHLHGAWRHKTWEGEEVVLEIERVEGVDI